MLFPLQIQVTLNDDLAIVMHEHFEEVIIGPQENDYIIIINDEEELTTFTYLVTKLNKKK